MFGFDAGIDSALPWASPSELRSSGSVRNLRLLQVQNGFPAVLSNRILLRGFSNPTLLNRNLRFAEVYVWRRGWDSNPRGACAPSRFRVGAVMTASVPLLKSVRH